MALKTFRMYNEVIYKIIKFYLMVDDTSIFHECLKTLSISSVMTGRE